MEFADLSRSLFTRNFGLTASMGTRLMSKTRLLDQMATGPAALAMQGEKQNIESER